LLRGKKHQLPHQQLFLMQSHHVGSTELITESAYEKYAVMTKSKDKLNSLILLKILLIYAEN